MIANYMRPNPRDFNTSQGEPWGAKSPFDHFVRSAYLSVLNPTARVAMLSTDLIGSLRSRLPPPSRQRSMSEELEECT